MPEIDRGAILSSKSPNGSDNKFLDDGLSQAHMRFNGYYQYRSHDGQLSQCKMTVFQLPDDRHLVIAARDLLSFGISPTNAAEQLASEISANFAIPPEKLVWIEHYAFSSGLTEESFDFVQFQYSKGKFLNPSWTGIRDIKETLASLGLKRGC